MTLRVPPGFDLDDAEAKPGWTQSRAGDAITWSGGRIPQGEYATFAIRGTAPKTAGTVTFNVLVGDRTGKSITYRVGLDVAKSTTRDNGARTLGKAALARRARRGRACPRRRSSSGSTSGSAHLRPPDD